MSTYNPPGRSSIDYRVGTHGRFMAAMLERLASRPELGRLTARTTDDPAIALLDCWAVVADVLTFYGERHAQEGYLATAVEAESLVRLGRLVGHRPRPALGAGGYLAYTLDPGARTVVPAGSQAKSVPAQGGSPQTFETSEDLTADAAWNTLPVRMTAPPRLRADAAPRLERLTFTGSALGLRPGDRLLLLFGSAHEPVVRVVAGATADYPAALTAVDLVPDVPADPAETAREALLAAARSGPRVLAATVLRASLAAALERLAPDGGAASHAYARVADADRLLTEGVAFTTARGNAAAAGWLAGEVADAVRALRAALSAVAAEQRRSLPEAEYLRALAHALACPCTDGENENADENADGYGSGDGCGSPDCDRATALVATASVLPALRRTPPRPPAAGRDLVTDPCEAWDPRSDVVPGLLAAADPRLAGAVHRAWATQRIAPPRENSGVQVLRVKARPVDPALDPQGAQAPPGSEYLYLEGHFDTVLPGSRVLAEQARTTPGSRLVRVLDVTQLRLPFPSPAGAPPVFVPVTRLTVDGPWHGTPEGDAGVPYGDITVWAAGEDLALADDPVTEDVAGARIELAGVCTGLLPGRRLVVSGERTDVPGTTGVRGGEPVMLASVRQSVDAGAGGDTVHTELLLAAPLTYTYRRDTVTVHGNVVPATQGETRSEVLGSGDASRGGQSFALRGVTSSAPLTYLPAATPDGAEPALTVRVDGVRRPRTEDLSLLGPADPAYALGRDPGAGTATVAFGDGVHGARLRSGVENVTAVYRVGAGPDGNLAPGLISQAVSRPLGVGSVTNPLASTGGADADGLRDLRAVVPLRTRALDRLLSVRDYADFARARAGIGRAAAARLFDGRREIVHVTVAAAGDVPVTASDPLTAGLEAALAGFGDPHVPVRVDVRELVLLVLSAGVKVLPDHSFETVEPAVRAAVLGVLGFAARDLAEPARLSRVLAAAQAVPGVDHLDVDVFAGIGSAADPLALVDLVSGLRGAAATVDALPARAEPRVHVVGDDPTGAADTLTSIALRHGLRVEELVALNPGLRSPEPERGRRLVVSVSVRPAQLAVMTPDLPQTLILRRLP
ncbi:putative baseplate assembly protein [Streptomyces lavendulae]|uniref:putative baseplate assembly protein n=1 Tax=Streptomyces lavendulae TaxID=1914 RepID=UPI0036B58D56